MLQQRTYISTGERIRNYLSVGFVLSLILNALLAPLYPELKAQVEQVKPDVLSILHPIRIITPPPKPTPPPKKQLQPRTHTQPRPLVVHPPITHATSGPVAPAYVPPKDGLPTGAPPDVPGTGPSAATTDTGTTQPSCAMPNHDASVIDAMSPDYPDAVRDSGLGAVSVLVQVTIDERGRLIDSKIYQSSRNAAIDQAALRAARQSSYAPRIENCEPVEGTYIFRADFSPNSMIF